MQDLGDSHRGGENTVFWIEELRIWFLVHSPTNCNFGKVDLSLRFLVCKVNIIYQVHKVDMRNVRHNVLKVSGEIMNVQKLRTFIIMFYGWSKNFRRFSVGEATHNILVVALHSSRIIFKYFNIQSINNKLNHMRA